MSVALVDNSSKVMDWLGGNSEDGLKAVAQSIAEQAASNIRTDLNTTGASTDDLASDVHIEMTGKGFDAVARIGVSLIYGRIHEIGGIIEATNAPYLVFQTADGEFHSVQTVTMPARPWLRPAAMMMLPSASQSFKMGWGVGL